MKDPFENNLMKIYKSDCFAELKTIPLFISVVAAGFPSPADDYLEQELDLNKYLISHPSSTFIARAKGSSMINAGIHEGDLMIIDKSIRPSSNSIVIAIIDGEFTVKRLKRRGNYLYLIPENPSYDELLITEEMDFQIWGVVIYIIHKT